ncbi:MAG: hypothetical protein WC941_05985 [Candidatus Bathyarchaeia archaeon]|jgi:hypothetical protein
MEMRGSRPRASTVKGRQTPKWRLADRPGVTLRGTASRRGGDKP